VTALQARPETVAGPLVTTTVGARPEGTGNRLEEDLAAVLAGVLRVDRVPVDSHFFDDLGADSMVMAQFCARLRKRDDLPSASIKDVYQKPTIRDLAGDLAPVRTPVVEAPAADRMAEVLAGILGVDRVPVDSHFFDDLGADSMVMAQFCARLRKRDDLPSASIKDVYRHPTIRGLAGALTEAPGAPPLTPTAPAGRASPDAAPSGVPEAGTATEPPVTGRPHVVLCGALQVLAFLGYTYWTTFLALTGVEWAVSASDDLRFYLRSVVVGSLTFASMCVFPIVAKWLLIGRAKPQRLRVWSLGYVRFWVVKTLIRANPLARFFPGSPLFNVYLRALGARIGPGAVIFARTVPVAADLVEIGAGAVVRKDVQINGYRVVAGVVETGPVTLGRFAYVGEANVLDIGTSMGDGATLGFSSSLHEGQSVPAGETWHGSPARRTETNYRTVEPRPLHAGRRVAYALLQLFNTAFIVMPLTIGVLDAIIADVPLLDLDLASGPLTSAEFWLDCLLVSAIVYFGGAIGSLLYVVTVPRLLRLGMRADRVYPLYGLRYSIQRTVARTTNSKFLTGIFGDSSYIVGYLQAIGYRMRPVQQTGSNFGTGVTHDSPFHTRIGTGTMAADGLAIINADYTSSSFRVSRVTIAAHSFFGNAITYPPEARLGENVLLANKVLVPIDGPVRSDVGLLGSPAFEIPRSVERDATNLARLEAEIPRQLRRKNRYNLRTILITLLVRWIGFAISTTLILAAAHHYDRFGAIAVAVGSVLVLLATTAFGVLVERTSTRFRPLSPRFCSIYDPYFWWHERFWKMNASPALFSGTPFKGPVLRLLGVRVGRRLYDDGCGMPERSLIRLGDDCTLNAGSTLQPHSQEDASFKSDHITLGSGCTVGVGAWVHYAVTMGDGAVVAPDAFVMKGEEVPPGTVWSGNPAAPVATLPPPPPATPATPANDLPDGWAPDRPHGHAPTLNGSVVPHPGRPAAGAHRRNGHGPVISIAAPAQPGARGRHRAPRSGPRATDV
jgi:non-ribosomal peptide synthetase-like protein